MARTKSENGKASKEEAKDERFLRIAPRRVASCLSKIRQVKNLANDKVYEYTPEQRDKICDAVMAACSDLVDAFNGKAQSQMFTL